MFIFFQVIRTGLEQGILKGYEAESNGFAELGMSSESKALKSLFFGQVDCYDSLYNTSMILSNLIGPRQSNYLA